MSRNDAEITLAYARPSGAERWGKVGSVGVWFSVAGVVSAVVGYGLMVFVDVGVVLGLGPILVALGSTGAVLCGMGRRWNWMVMGGSQVVISAVFFGCVLVFGWGPGEARGHFAGMGAVYLGMVGCALVGMGLRWLRRE